MIIKSEKTYRGKFRLDNKRCKTGRVSIPAELVRKEDFPFKNGSTVTITYRVDYLIIESLKNGRIEMLKEEK